MSKKVIEEKTNDTDTKIETIQDTKTQNTKKDTKQKKVKKTGEKGKLTRKAGETIAELKKVTWPSFGTILKKTGIVLAFCAMSLVALLLIDLLLKFVVEFLVGIK